MLGIKSREPAHKQRMFTAHMCSNWPYGLFTSGPRHLSAVDMQCIETAQKAFCTSSTLYTIPLHYETIVCKGHAVVVVI